MTTLEALCAEIAGLQADDVRRWIANAWVRPLGVPLESVVGESVWYFEAIDVARVRLIVELRDELHVEEDTLPVVLSLLDQVHALRRQLVTLQAAITQAAPADVRDSILLALRQGEGGA